MASFRTWVFSANSLEIQLLNSVSYWSREYAGVSYFPNFDKCKQFGFWRGFGIFFFTISNYLLKNLLCLSQFSFPLLLLHVKKKFSYLSEGWKAYLALLSCAAFCFVFSFVFLGFFVCFLQFYTVLIAFWNNKRFGDFSCA